MAYRITVHPHVRKFLSSQDPDTKSRLVDGLRKLEIEPLDRDIKKLKDNKGKQDLYRLRIGNYRAVFAIEDDVVYILELFHREHGYKWLL